MSRVPTAWAAMTARGGLRRVLVAYWLYSVVEMAAWIVIVLWAYARGGAALAGTAAVIQLIPSALLVPVLASIGDRMPRGTALAVAHTAVAITTLVTAIAVATNGPTWTVIAASTALTCTVAVVRPIHYAALPQLSNSADELVSANALSSSGQQLSYLVGPIVAGFGVQLVGAAAILVALAVVATMGLGLCLGLHLVAPVPEHHVVAAEEPAALRRDIGSLALILVLTTTSVLGGALDVLGVAFGESVLQQGPSGAGLVVGAIGIGGLIGASFATFVAGRRRLTGAIVAAAAAQGLAFATVSLVSELLPTMALIALAGAAGAILVVTGRTLLQRATDARRLAHVFAALESSSQLGLAIGAGLAPLLIGLSSPSLAFLPLGVAATVLALGACALVRRLDARALYRPLEVALLREVPCFHVLPIYSIEQLARTAHWNEVSPGDVVVRQGESGETFHIIADGRFTVTIDGVLRPHQLGPGEGFGEIALLHQVPRTATITALGPGRLLTVQGNDFLAAVTQSSEGASIAAENTAHHLARDRSTQV